MTAILKQYWFYNLYSITKKINGFIYYMQKIPVVGKIFSSSLYAQYDLKKIIFGFLFIFQLVMSVLMKFLWLALYYALACLWQPGADFKETLFAFKPENMLLGLVLWSVVVSFWLYNINNLLGLVESGQKDYIKQFQVSRQGFLSRTLIFDILLQVIYYLPAAILYAILGHQLLLLLLVPFMYAFGAFLGSWMSRVFYLHKWKTLMRWFYSLLALFIGSGALAASRYAAFPVSVKFAVVALVTVGLTFLSLYKIRSFPRENEYYLYLSESQLAFDTKMTAASNKDQQYIKAGLDMQKQLTVTNDRDFSNLHGSAYLNALLFDRYGKILRNKLYQRLGVIAAVAVFLVVVSLSGVTAAFTQKDMISFLPLLFFVMYFSSLGKSIVQMVFVNCDVAMLYYPFYRERKTILSGFNYRLLRTLIYNGLISLALLLLFVIFNGVNHFFLDGRFFLVLILLLIGLTALFSFHELFIYYILQPFTGDMQVVNPLYRIVSGALYWIAYINSRIKVAGMTYVVIVSTACIIYAIIGYFVIVKKAPDTFRIKA